MPPSAPVRLSRGGPGIAPIEGLLEFEEPTEVLDAVAGLGDQDPGFHKSEDDLSEVLGGVDPPVFENSPGEEAGSAIDAS
jgi:hypothetical protein